MVFSRMTDKRIASIQAKTNRRRKEQLKVSTPKEEFSNVYS